MGVSIEFANRFEPLVLPQVSTTELAQAMNLAMAKNHSFFVFNEPGEEEPLIFHMKQILIVRPVDEDAIGSGF